MPECSYCEQSFDSEDAYHDHLADAHRGELSRIDRRRIEGSGSGSEDSEFPTGPVVLIGVIAFALVLVVYVVFFLGGVAGSGGTVNGINVAQTPTEVGSTHLHGPINVTIDGQELDFSRPRFQKAGEYPAFHFEGGDGQFWHGHARGITLEYAMATLGIDVDENSVSYEGTTYRNSDNGTSVSVTVNGQAVNPRTFTLSGPATTANAQQGDFIRIVVETGQ